MEQDKIIIRGAKENNLKNIDLDIPRNQLVVMMKKEAKDTVQWYLMLLLFRNYYGIHQRYLFEGFLMFARLNKRDQQSNQKHL